MGLSRINDRELGSNELICLEDAGKAYGRSRVLNGISLQVQRGKCTALVGRNGSGKSTLLRLIAGLTRPTDGMRKVRAGRLVTGYVPERFPPLPFTPSEYLLSSAEVRGIDKLSGRREMEDYLQLLGMEGYAHARMNQFSKGMLQKINLIQAMMGSPDLLLLDEPLSGLDTKAQESLLHLLTDLKNGGTAIVMSVHESTLIEGIADRVLLMKNGAIVEESDGGLQDSLKMTRIVVRGLNEDAIRQLAEHPSVLFASERTEAWELDVLTGSTDLLLRQMLDRGGSIVSVIPADRMNLHLGAQAIGAAEPKGDAGT